MNPEEILVKNAMTQPSRTAGNLVEDQAQPWVYKHVGKYLFRISPSGTISCFGGNRERITVALSELFTSLKNIGIAVPEKTVIKFHNIASEMKLRESCACGKPSIS